MAFGRFNFKKLWTSPTDFPTIEVDEAQVRADMQALHDESKEGLNQLMTELEAGAAAASLGAKTLGTGKDSTVQQVMEDLRIEMQEGHKDLDKDRHTHENSSVLEKIEVALTDALAAAYGRLATLLDGITGVATTLGSDHTTIPTSKAVSDALTQAGNLPTGGETGQVLMKRSDANYDMEWGTINVPVTAVRVDFYTSDWESDGAGGYTLTVKQMRHGRTNEAFACLLRHKVDGVLKQNTWAVLGTDSAYDTKTGDITLSSPEKYAGAALLVDQGSSWTMFYYNGEMYFVAPGTTWNDLINADDTMIEGLNYYDEAGEVYVEAYEGEYVLQCDQGGVVFCDSEIIPGASYYILTEDLE